MQKDRITRMKSWKDIADFLGISVRTAQRWERLYSLPVRRLPGGLHSRVFALEEELNSWSLSNRCNCVKTERE